MLRAFLILAAQSPGRQRAFRAVLAVHLVVGAGALWGVWQGPSAGGTGVLGSLLLLAGIVEGAVLLGWRLAQLPKSQALEFLLVSPMPPGGFLAAEALVGLIRLALATLSALPLLAILEATGRLDPLDLIPLLVMPWTWGAITGLGLVVWAYEPLTVRRWGERGMLALTIVYLGVGVLAGEHLRQWLGWVSPRLQQWCIQGFTAFDRYNPFAVLHTWLTEEPAETWRETLAVELLALTLALLLLVRAAMRVKAHFHERHYQPAARRSGRQRPGIGDHPLAWWAVQRVTQYSGRINFWLAGGFGLLYALYLVAGPAWPTWLGRTPFLLLDRLGGSAALGAALVVLAAVPAAFQYGLWDSSTQDRCRRLELLLLTPLGPQDYWQAAAAAAWRRGRGYFGVACLLWIAAWLAGRSTIEQVAAALATGVLLWGLYFALGFRAFTRGRQANGLGLVLTLGLPLAAYVCWRAGWPTLVALLPPGNVYLASGKTLTAPWLAGPAISALLSLGMARTALNECDGRLRQWYDQHHGQKVLD